ncbi:MAG TPA: hypothetical protein VF707_16590 [Ardenticatenaceae bacterium]|jgi:hypothetical protein
MAHVLFVFHDGVGIGANDAASNPFIEAEIPVWRGLAGGDWPTLDDAAPRHSQHATVLGADATLGVPGEPQSGTGTTALLTGENAPAQYGRHMGPFPPSALKPLLREKNLFSQIAALGGRIAFANAYPPFYLERLERGRARRTTCTQAALAAGLTLRGYEALRDGQALSSWITNEHWRRFDADIPDVSPFEAGENLARLALGHEFTLFEYFHTDHSGHRPGMAEAHAALQRLDGLLAGIIGTIDPERDLLVTAADHGNFEEQRHSRHTTNPALVTVWGKGHREVAAGIAAITDIAPALLGWLADNGR